MGESEELSTRPRLVLRRRRPETNPLFLAVMKNDLEELKALVESGKSVNTTNSRGNTLLNYVISHQRFEMFDYLLGCGDLEIDRLNTYGQNSLLYTATDNFDEHFALELIKKGANVHIADDAGFTFLHLAVKYTGDSSLKLGQLVIEKGVNIDAQACYGVTPLYAACEEGCFNWIYMLLYYGASALIPSHNGILPVAVLSPAIPPDEYVHLEEVLFNHTFDDVEVSVALPTLVAAMALDSSLFSKIVNVASDVSYDMSDLKSLYSFLIHVKAKHFRVFVEKFGHILREMIENFAPLTMLVGLGADLDLPELREILWIFLESDHVSKFVQTSDHSYPIIGRLVQMFNKPEMFLEEEEITRMVCIMLTHGLNVTSNDLDAVYSYYGYCELFRILLHIDVQIVINHAKKEYPVAALYYDLNTEIKAFFNEFSISSTLLSYYNHPRFKEICLSGFVDEETCAKAASLPPVPYLIELSRNVARKYIVSRFNIKNCSQFYTVLKWLPIGEMTKKIIALETELY